MVHLVYSVQALLSSDYFKNNGNDKLKDDLETKSKTQEDIIFMMNSYDCPKKIALKVKEVYTLMNKDELGNKLFEFTTKQNIALRSWY